MLSRFRKDPLIGNILGVIALFIALGAGAYAATHLKPNSVKSKHIVDGQVKTQDIAEGAIRSTLVPNEELIGDDIDEETLGAVPNALGAGLLDGKDSTEFQAAGTEGWTDLQLNDGGFPIGCYWENFPGGFGTPGYFRDRDGIVHLRGVVRAHDGSSINCGTPSIDEVIAGNDALPNGYRPEARALFTVSSNNKPARVDILANTGQIRAEPGYPTYADMEVWVSLDGISFRCGPSGANGCP